MRRILATGITGLVTAWSIACADTEISGLAGDWDGRTEGAGPSI